MKMFFVSVFLLVALEITYFPCEGGKIRRQIWRPPPNPNLFWGDYGPRDDGNFFSDGDFWVGPPRFDKPPRNNDDFGNGFNPGGGRNDRNQNRRTTTTESTETITSPPRTIHVAPQGCNCPMTQQFNPVCGTDGNTYRNRGLLNCYTRCGTNVAQKRLGTC